MAKSGNQGTLMELQDQVAKLAGRVDKLTVEAHARLLQEMKAHVEQFTHLALPLELADDAPEGAVTAQEHFVWLKTMDTSPGQEHWRFFNGVLARANAALEGGNAGEPLDDDELHRRAIAYAEKHKVDYTTALKTVATGTTV